MVGACTYVHVCTSDSPSEFIYVCTYIPCLQAESWIQEKLQVANDGSYQDPTNLENKLQKHQECEAEVNANHQRIQNIAEVRKYVRTLNYHVMRPPPNHLLTGGG